MDVSSARLNENVPLSRHWLESLSSGELVKLADSFGIDIPPGLERIFIIEELLENSIEETRENEDELETAAVFTETAALPKQYNISFIEVMIRDPLWVFAFWEIKGHDKELHEKADDFAGYCLRVIPLNENGAVSKARDDSFTVALDVNDSARYLGFPEQSVNNAGRYIIKLCVIRGTSELPIAVSLPFELPPQQTRRLAENEGIRGPGQNPLIYLSGVRDFATIKSTDRVDRRSIDRRSVDRGSADRRSGDKGQ